MMNINNLEEAKEMINTEIDNIDGSLEDSKEYSQLRAIIELLEEVVENNIK